MAEQEYTRACPIYETALGTNHITTAQIYARLGFVIGHKRGQYNHARKLLHEALQIHESLMGTSHPNTSDIYQKLGRILIQRRPRPISDHLDDLQSAIQFLGTALALYKQDYNMHRPAIAECYWFIGVAHKARNESEALDAFQNCLAIREQIYGSDHPVTNKTREKVAEASGWVNW